MSDISHLLSRIEAAFSIVKEKAVAQQQDMLKRHQEREQLMKEYEKVQPKILAVTVPRLEAFAKRAGDRATVTPLILESRRSAQFEFRSPKAFITLTFSTAPDRDIKNVVVEYDLKIVPVLWKFVSHGEFITPIASPDYDGLVKWLDDRIMDFVEIYIQIHEYELYDNAEYVEDPVAKVKFPKFAAGASLEHGGQTYFFIDNSSKAAFAKQKGIATA
jgi:YHS domain-containing protein